MSLFQCANCGCRENTALSFQGFTLKGCFDWTGFEQYQGQKLCSVCGPRRFSEGSATHAGVWHDQFPRRFLPKKLFKTNAVGNLEHCETGEPPNDYFSDTEF